MPERSEVPEGWVFVPLGDIISPSKGKIEPSDNPDLKYIGLEHIESNGCRIVSNGQSGDTKSTKTVFHTGDLLYGKLRPYLNKVCIPDFDGVCSTDILVFKRSSHLNNRYVMWFLSIPDFVDYANNNSSGVQLPRISFQKLSCYHIPLPPLAEQHRIVAAVEALFARLDAANARLERVPGILKQFRQAVLAAACEGRLTEDWRVENPNWEDGSVVISRIVAERKSQSVIGDKNKGQVIIPQIIQDGNEKYFEIPPSWIWVRFGTVLGEIKNGISIKPHNDPPGAPILRISALRARDVNLSDCRYLRNSETYIKSYRLEDNDLLFTRYSGSEEFVGICGLVRDIKDNVVLYPDKLIRVRFDHQQILPDYAELFYINRFARQIIIDSSKSSAGQRGISGKNIRDLPLALPPLPEQHEIVRRVDALFALADRIEAEVAAARAKTETMRQSILALAFSGRLVPTEAELARREGCEYEPASVLLERICSEKKEKTGRRGTQSTLV